MELSVEVLTNFIEYRRSSISFSLQNPQPSNSVSARLISLSYAAFIVVISIPLPHNVDLKIIIHFVCCILTINQALHVLDVLFGHVVLLDQIAPVSINSVKFLEHQIESALERFIVIDKLI